ncbi:unnamed protein product [Haemonchus placei]|uniref:Uncharacterized protein n=1 Tax=Haemonchus placei TaxID=6290 RepID=A0A3P7YRB6_HAEPC|nr:unnamed protein product [Haemonchus placei]
MTRISFQSHSPRSASLIPLQCARSEMRIIAASSLHSPVRRRSSTIRGIQ